MSEVTTKAMEADDLAFTFSQIHKYVYKAEEFGSNGKANESTFCLRTASALLDILIASNEFDIMHDTEVRIKETFDEEKRSESFKNLVEKIKKIKEAPTPEEAAKKLDDIFEGENDES